MTTNPMTLAHAIARELGDGWSASSGEHGWVRLSGPDAVELHVSFGGWRLDGRIRISGEPTREERQQHMYYSDEKLPSITVSDSKPAAAIARDITRRLLPSYLPRLAELRERKAAHDDYEARRTALVRELLSRMPGSTWNPERDNDKISLPYRSERLYGWVRVSSDSANFDIHVSTREAALILADAIAAIGKAA